MTALPVWSRAEATPGAKKRVLGRRIGRGRFHNQQAVAVDDGLKLFEITGLESTFTIVPTRAAAMNGGARG